MSNQKMNDEFAGGNLLNFETTMAQFEAMFPQLSGRMIESVLRKYDGNVGQTIEELLERSATQNHSECPQSSSTTGQNRNNGEYTDEIEALKRAANRGELNNGQNCHQNHPQSSSSSSAENGTQQSRRDPCADDEKIALLIQNREFLRYLRHDPNFRQAMISQHQASANARHSSRWPLPPGPTMPPQLLLATRAARSPNTHRLFHRLNGSGKSERRVEREKPEPVPDGPIVEFAERDPALAIPEGPLIDYEDSQHDASTSSATGWAHRIKAKLASKTGGRPPEGAEQIPPSPLVHFSDAEMQKGIQGMLARGGRGFLEGLANKFSARKQRINNGGGDRMERLGEDGGGGREL